MIDLKIETNGEQVKETDSRGLENEILSIERM